MTLCSNISYSQRPLTDSELRIVYEKVIKGEWCAEDLAASQEVIKSLSVIIDSLNSRIQQNTLFVDGLIAENDRLAKENYGLVAGIEQKKAKPPIRLLAGGELTPISIDSFAYKGGAGIQLRGGTIIKYSYDNKGRHWVGADFEIFKIR